MSILESSGSSSKRLLEIVNDVVNVLGTDGYTDQVLVAISVTRTI
jgi:hypothetical protein